MTRLEKIACICVSLLSFGVLVFVALQFGWVAKVASLGDVLTLGSIVVAAILAFFGWRRADKVACEERERIAKADGLILYRQLNDASYQGAGILVDVVKSPFGNLLARFPDPISDNGNELFRFYRWFQSVMLKRHQSLVEVEKCYGDSRSLYIFKTSFGDVFMDVMRNLNALLEAAKAFIKDSPEDLVKGFKQNPTFQIQNFYTLLVCAARLSHSLELCRRTLDGVEFDDPFVSISLAEYSRLLSTVFGEDDPFKGKSMGADEYVKILEVSTYLFVHAYEQGKLTVPVG